MKSKTHVTRGDLAALIIRHKNEVLARISELEQKEQQQTISHDEGNELDILYDHNDFKVYDEVLALIEQGRFGSVQALASYLRKELSDIPALQDAGPGNSEDTIQIETLSKANFARLITLDNILFELERVYHV